MQRAEAAHGDAGNAARGPGGLDAVAALDGRHEFANEEILVADTAVVRVQVEGASAVRGDDEKVAEGAVAAQVFEESGAAVVHEGLFVLAEAVQPVEDGEAASG